MPGDVLAVLHRLDHLLLPALLLNLGSSVGVDISLRKVIGTSSGYANQLAQARQVI